LGGGIGEEVFSLPTAPFYALENCLYGRRFPPSLGSLSAHGKGNLQQRKRSSQTVKQSNWRKGAMGMISPNPDEHPFHSSLRDTPTKISLVPKYWGCENLQYESQL